MSSAAPSVPTITGKAINWSILLSILLIIAGFLTLMIPFIGGIGIAIFVGWAMVVSGVTHFIYAFKTHAAGSLLWELLLGAVYLITGVYVLLHPLAGLASLTLLLAIYLFVEAIFEVIHYFQVRPRSGAGWLLLDGLVTFVLALMIWRSWPASALWAVGTLVGISMLFSGFSRLMLALAAKRAVSTLP
ncbi:MAG: DUF308 domain-containing protein [Edaphobacter sp.]|uniref:HdeD family acid-resistance protein n=1 Tax=Edaphobacter sp. TaxID=1934404 RepID=UPI00239519F6|nr:DUF308 domain-containing protein [Edaphobacter sp.]MDE1177496.1 DUF308 domain-containing protein [Edaphobacter sp.]